MTGCGFLLSGNNACINVFLYKSQALNSDNSEKTYRGTINSWFQGVVFSIQGRGTMAENYWTLLGIEPTKDVEAIKNAYTSVVHGIDPKSDPQKFRALRKAYNEAIVFSRSDQPVPQPGEADDAGDKEPGQAAKPVKDGVVDINMMIDDSVIVNAEADRIMNAIAAFREKNNLTESKNLINMPYNTKGALVKKLFGMYKELAEKTNDTSVWNVFFGEPLAKEFDELNPFREWMLYQFKTDSPHREKIAQILEKHKLASGSSPEELVKPPVVYENKRTPDQKMFLLECIVFALLALSFLFVAIVGAIKVETFIIALACTAVGFVGLLYIRNLK